MYQIIPFGEWLPDIPAFSNPGLTTAKNVYPGDKYYHPFPDTTGFSTALTARAQGHILTRDSSASLHAYAGDVAQLYRFNPATSSWSDVSRTVGGAYTTPTSSTWEFAPWAQTIIAVNGAQGDVPQRLSYGAANFVALPGSPPPAEHIATIRDFVVLGNISATAYMPQAVQWSAINNPDSWTADAATLADRQDLPGDGGKIQKIIGGEYGVIFQERAIYRMTFVGSPLVFQFDKIQRNVGALAPNSVIAHKNIIYFLAESGFYAFDGVNLDPIGAGKIDKTIGDQLRLSQVYLVSARIIQRKKLVCWSYRSYASSSTVCDRILIYHWEQRKWSQVEGLDIELLANISNASIVEEQLGAFNSSHTLKWYLTDDSFGATMVATLETGDFQLNPEPEGRACITKVTPLIHGLSAPCTLTISSRNDIGRYSVSTKTTNLTAGGAGAIRASGKFQRIKIVASGSADLTNNKGPMAFQGLQIEYHIEGKR